MVMQIMREQSRPRFRLAEFCFPKQLAFIEDESPYKTAVCSRRAGKTTACAAHLIDSALKNKGSTNLYITLSRLNAKRIIWSELRRINHEFKLQGNPNDTELFLEFPNGSKIFLTGAKDQREIEKFRGIAVKLVYIDEAQSFKPYIKELIDDVIGPSLIDYAGTLCLIGTPGPVPAGYFHECAVQSKEWSHHSWTFWDNPFIEIKSGMPHSEILARELKRRGVAADDPSIQREWFGKWVLDTSSLLLNYDEIKNHYDELPPNLEYILGVDLGFEDADALAVVGWNGDSPNIYLVEEIVQNKQGLTELAELIRSIQSRYKLQKIVMDEGALGKKIAEEFRRRFQIPVHPAEKTRKMENVTFLNDALRGGRFKAKRQSQFAQETFLVEIDREASTPDRLRLKDSFHSDIIDAVLYAFKASPAFYWTEKLAKTSYGTPEWFKHEEEAIEEAAEEYFKTQSEWGKL